MALTCVSYLERLNIYLLDRFGYLEGLDPWRRRGFMEKLFIILHENLASWPPPVTTTWMGESPHVISTWKGWRLSYIDTWTGLPLPVNDIWMDGLCHILSKQPGRVVNLITWKCWPPRCRIIKKVPLLIKKNIKFSSYIRKFRREHLQSHIWLMTIFAHFLIY
jgi:hypothetical protein